MMYAGEIPPFVVLSCCYIPPSVGDPPFVEYFIIYPTVLPTPIYPCFSLSHMPWLCAHISIWPCLYKQAHLTLYVMIQLISFCILIRIQFILIKSIYLSFVLFNVLLILAIFNKFLHGIRVIGASLSSLFGDILEHSIFGSGELWKLGTSYGDFDLTIASERLFPLILSINLPIFGEKWILGFGEKISPVWYDFFVKKINK